MSSCQEHGSIPSVRLLTTISLQRGANSPWSPSSPLTEKRCLLSRGTRASCPTNPLEAHLQTTVSPLTCSMRQLATVANAVFGPSSTGPWKASRQLHIACRSLQMDWQPVHFAQPIPQHHSMACAPQVGEAVANGIQIQIPAASKLPQVRRADGNGTPHRTGLAGGGRGRIAIRGGADQPQRTTDSSAPTGNADGRWRQH